ncbi:hypothetical protein TNCV_3459901 [Trichonephila clavipes]|nr:hypothetical protein TNCV_3459901 [Trichonephila clavipes]
MTTVASALTKCPSCFKGSGSIHSFPLGISPMNIKSYSHLHGAQDLGQRQPLATMNFAGLDLTLSDRRKTDFFPQEDTTMSHSGFKPEPTRLQAKVHSHHTGWATFVVLISRTGNFVSCISKISKRGRGSQVVKVSDRGWCVVSLSPVPLRTRRIGERDVRLILRELIHPPIVVVVRRGYQLRCRPRQFTMVQNYEVRHQKSSCS